MCFFAWCVCCVSLHDPQCVCVCAACVCVERDAKTSDRAELRRYWRISMLLAGWWWTRAGRSKGKDDEAIDPAAAADNEGKGRITMWLG